MKALWDRVRSYVKRKWWYMFLLGLSTIYVLYNRYNIYDLDKINAMSLIFVLWLVLMLFPLFSEMEFLGVKLKKEVEKAKGEMNENINELRSQILTMKVSNVQSFSYNAAPTIPEMNDIIRDNLGIKKEAERSDITNANMNTPTESIENKKDEEIAPEVCEIVSEDNVYLFKSRMVLEEALSILCDKFDYSGKKSIMQMSIYLFSLKLLDKKTLDQIKHISSICNRGVHGEVVSKVYIEFVEQVLHCVLSKINEITTRFGYKHIFFCTRCQYTGYSEIDNECPKCHYISDE